MNGKYLAKVTGPHLATRLPGRHADDVCVEFLQDFFERHKDGPFFAYYSTKLVHVPQAPTPDADRETIEVYQRAFEQANDRDLTGVDAYAREEAARRKIEIDSKRFRNDGIRYLDKMVGQLIDTLDRLGIRDNTLVLFTSDNGNSQLDPLPEGVQPLPGKKGDSREGGTRVPLIANWPGQITPGSHCRDLVHVQDFLPTLVDLAGGTVPEGRACDGRSFAPQLLGKQGSPREWFIGTGAHPNVWLDRVAEELGKPDLEPHRLVWVHGLRYKLYDDGRFYDLHEDLAEARRIPPGSGSAEAELVARSSKLSWTRTPIFSNDADQEHTDANHGKRFGNPPLTPTILDSSWRLSPASPFRRSFPGMCWEPRHAWGKRANQCGVDRIGHARSLSVVGHLGTSESGRGLRLLLATIRLSSPQGTRNKTDRR